MPISDARPHDASPLDAAAVAVDAAAVDALPDPCVRYDMGEMGGEPAPALHLYGAVATAIPGLLAFDERGMGVAGGAEAAAEVGETIAIQWERPVAAVQLELVFDTAVYLAVDDYRKFYHGPAVLELDQAQRIELEPSSGTLYVRALGYCRDVTAAR